MYQSPIEIISKQMRTELENDVYKAILDYGIDIDKDELIKALAYDRDQYDKGYNDGIRDGKIAAYKEIVERLKNEM